MATALGESASGLQATKDDITNIKIEMADIKSELKLMKWMVVTIVAGVISLVVKVFFYANSNPRAVLLPGVFHI